MMEKYIRNQIQDDVVAEQLSLMEYIDPFTGEKVKKATVIKIETKHTKIDAIIMDKDLDLQWFGINEDIEG